MNFAGTARDIPAAAVLDLVTALRRAPHDREHSVKRVICSAIPRADHAAIEARWGVPWHEAFGMTESGLDIAVELADHDEAAGRGPSLASARPQTCR